MVHVKPPVVVGWFVRVTCAEGCTHTRTQGLSQTRAWGNDTHERSPVPCCTRGPLLGLAANRTCSKGRVPNAPNQQSTNTRGDTHHYACVVIGQGQQRLQVGLHGARVRRDRGAHRCRRRAEHIVVDRRDAASRDRLRVCDSKDSSDARVIACIVVHACQFVREQQRGRPP